MKKLFFFTMLVIFGLSINAQTAYITNSGSYTVSVINVATNTVTHTIAVGIGPYGVSVNPDDSKVYITNTVDNTVSVINAATDTVSATIAVGNNPLGISVSPNGNMVYVANTQSNSVSVINSATNTVSATIPVGSYPRGISVSPDGSKVYVGNYNDNTVNIINTATNTVSATITGVSNPWGIIVSPNGSKVYVANQCCNTVSVIDTASNTVSAMITVGNNPDNLSISPDGSKVYVANQTPNTVSVINTAANTVTATVTGFNNPCGVSVSPDGKKVYVANSGNGTVSVINTATNTVSATITVGNNPAAMGNFITGFEVTTTETNVSCYGGNNGTATANPFGGKSPFIYLWNTTPAQTAQTATGLIAGSYMVTVTDSNSVTKTDSVTITQPDSMIITISPSNASCYNTGSASATHTGGTSPYSYLWSNGQTTPVVTGLLAGIYTLTITDANSCTSTQTINIANNPPPAPSICEVTVDSLSKYNDILWDKTPYSGGIIDSFIVYREITSNNYQPIGAVAFDSLSMFVDTVRAKYFPYTGDPNNGTYRYKLAVHDTCGNYSAMSNYHNTIFTTNTSGIFSWNFYTIENTANPVTGYLLMRDDNSTGNWHTVAGVSGTQQTVADPQYTTYQNTASWRVQTQWSISCSATTKMNHSSIGSTNLNASRSNLYKGIVVGNQEYKNSIHINIYPNPTNDNITIEAPLQATIEIFNIQGQSIKTFTTSGNKTKIDVSVLPSGVYIVEVKTEKGVAVRKFVKE